MSTQSCRLNKDKESTPSKSKAFNVSLKGGVGGVIGLVMLIVAMYLAWKQSKCYDNTLLKVLQFVLAFFFNILYIIYALVFGKKCESYY